MQREDSAGEEETVYVEKGNITEKLDNVNGGEAVQPGRQYGKVQRAIFS